MVSRHWLIWFFQLLVASNANIGGPATAAAMASARRWPEMVLYSIIPLLHTLMPTLSFPT
jgi:uncharacterized membrane protein